RDHPDHGDLWTQQDGERRHQDQREPESGDGLRGGREGDDEDDRNDQRHGATANGSGIARATAIASSSSTSAATMFDSAPEFSEPRVPSIPSATRPRSRS